MSKESQKRRQFLIKLHQKRRKKIKKLKEKYLEAKTDREREKILQKIFKINPSYPIESIQNLKK